MGPYETKKNQTTQLRTGAWNSTEFLKRNTNGWNFFKKCSILSVIQEMQTETILRFLSFPSWNDWVPYKQQQQLDSVRKHTWK